LTKNKKPITVYLPDELAEEVKNAVVFFSGPPLRLTLSDLATIAFRHEVDRLREKHNGGDPIPKRKNGPRPGRRVS